MNIGIFLQETSPESGGAFTFSETVISGLVSSGIQDPITVFHYGDSRTLETRLAGRATLQALASSRITRLLGRVYYKSFPTLFQKLTFKLSHVFGLKLSYPASSALDRAAKRAGIDILWFPTPASEPVECPYIFTVWDLEHRASPYFPEVSADGAWSSRERYFSDTLKRASYVITGTEVGKSEICRFYGVNPGRVRILPHPTPSFALAANTLLPHPNHLGVSVPYVIYPAQFWAHKNHIGLLDAAAALRGRNIEIHCALVGSDKGNQKYIERIARELGIEKQIHFLGFVSREDLIALYQNALALAYTSLCGPENLPPLEAMALGCPVIAADIDGAKEQLADAAILVNTSDAAALADAIQNLLSSQDLRKSLIEKGRIRARCYTESEFVRDLGKLFDGFRSIRRLWNPPG